MVKRFSLLAILMFALLVAGCDSSDAVATANARKAGTATAEATLTAISASTVTRTPTRTPAPTLTPSPAPETTEAPVATDAAATPAAAESPAPTAVATEAPTAEPTAAPTAVPTQAANVGAGVTTTLKVSSKVRSGPGLGRTTIGELAANTSVTVIGRQDNWLAIRFEGEPDSTGWIFRDWVSAADADLALLPVLAPAAAVVPSATPVPVVALDKNIAWFGQSTMYSLFVRSFRDSNGDGIGDLQGVIDGLDYIQSLGVKTIWLLPVFKSPSYHGYDIVDYYAINPDYGTTDDLIRLIKAVHQRGMYILLDYVFNHSSDQNPMFKDALANLNSNYSDFYRWADDKHTRAEGFAGLSSMPRFNFDSPKMRQYAVDVALYWMDPTKSGDLTAGVDGYRCDVASNIPRSFWAQLRTAMIEKNPRSVLLGELWTDPSQIVDYLQGDGLTAGFDFPSRNLIEGTSPEAIGAGIAAGATDSGPLRVTMLSLARRIGPQNLLVRFTNNHDTNRIMSNVNGDMQRARAAAVWLLTAPGIPIIYYGEELGMKGIKGLGLPYYDEYRREPLDWYAGETGKGMTTWFMPINRNNKPNDGISVEEEADKPDSLLTLYRTLGTLRAKSPALYGQNYLLPDAPGVYVVQRWSNDELFLVVINFSKQDQTLNKVSDYLTANGLFFDSKSLSVVVSQQSGDVTNDSLLLHAAGYVVLRAGK